MSREDSAQVSPIFASLVAELTFSAKMRELAASCNAAYANARSFNRLIALVGESTRGVVLDLLHPEAGQAAEWLHQRGDTRRAVLGYYPHVQREVPLRYARFEGMVIVTRSKFEGAFIDLLNGQREGRSSE